MIRTLLLLLAMSATAHAKYPPAIQSVASPHHAAVVRVFASDGAGKIANGTGVLIAKQGDRGLALTTWHNVKDGGPFHVQFPAGGSAFTVLAYNDLLDVAALLVATVPAGVEPIPLASKPPLSGSTVEFCGYGGGRWLATYPTVRGYHKHLYLTDTDIGLSIPSIGGESGAPVVSFELRKPRVAGIVWGGPQAYSNGQMEYAQATSSKAIAWWMEKTPELRGWVEAMASTEGAE